MNEQIPSPPVDLDFTGIFRLQDLKPEPSAPVVTPIPNDILVGARALEEGNYCVNMMRTRPARSVDPAKTTILIVEDDPSTLALLNLLLTRAGYQTRRASDAAAFAEALRQPPLPDLLILDVELPGNVSGLKILAKIRGHPAIRHLPVIIFTAHTEPQHLLQGVTLGADAYLSKPAKGQALMSVVKTALGG